MLKSYLIALSILLPALRAGAESSCEVFQYLPLSAETPYIECDSFQAVDKDHDGVSDYVTNPLYGETLFPFDDDLNNNDLPDVMEKHPEEFRHPLQERLWQRYGVLAIDDKAQDYQVVWQAAERILEGMNIRRNAHTLHRFRYLKPLRKEQTRQAHAYYMEPAHTIVFDPMLSQLPEKKIYSVLSHEIGHALLFSRLSAQNLWELARSQGGWLFHAFALDHYDGQFLKKFDGSKTVEGAFPTRYSEVNVHEWFAEHVSAFIMSKLGFQTPRTSPRMQQYLSNLIACKDKHVSQHACHISRLDHLAFSLSQP